jgi:glycosyltransferase involved in cell wall biosynthesis
MKLLVFAHTPPPHHGQSYMVQQMLARLGGDHRKHKGKSISENPDGQTHGIECYHVNAQVSKGLEDIGKLQIVKILLTLRYCLEAIWCRFRYGVKNFYYVPAPGKSVAVHRDWLVMFVCRPFFKYIILHWHAAGLAKWLETSVQIHTRTITYKAFNQPELSIVISKYNFADAEKLFSRRIRHVDYGIPDPCPNYVDGIQLRRSARFAARQKIMAGHALESTDYEQAGDDPDVIRVLFLAHCMKEKGVFDAMRAIALANATLAELQPRLRFRLIIGGSFVTQEEKDEYDKYMTESELAHSVDYWGFVSGETKERALREADLFCFPTYYLGENQPVSIIEAMAFGLPIVTTHWRSLPEMLPPGYCGLVPIRSPDRVAAALLLLMTRESGEGLRNIFLSRFTVEKHVTALAKAITSIEQSPPEPEAADTLG